MAPIKEKKPAERKIRASEVTNEPIASPLPVFASCSGCESSGDELATPDGMNSLTLRLVNYSGLDPKVAKRAIVLGVVKDDFQNYPSNCREP